MDDQDDQNEGRVSLSPDDLKALRDKAKEADRLAKENADLQRKQAFLDARIDPSDPKLSYFARGYEGDLTPEAIRAEAEKAGFITAASSTPPVSQEELAAHQKVGAAAAGGDSTEPFDFHKALADCKSPEEVMAMATKQQLPTVWNRPS